MILTIILLYFLGAILTYLVGNKMASKVAFGFTALTFVAFMFLLAPANDVFISYDWIARPTIKFAFQLDGLSKVMLFLTTGLAPIIILTSLKTEIANAKAFYAFVLFMLGAMAGTFLAADGLLYYIFWELSLLPIFVIGLFWGNNKANDLKKVMLKFFSYTFASSLFMLASFIFLYNKAGSFLLSDLYAVSLNYSEQFWIFLGFFFAFAVKIPIIPFHTWQAKTYTLAPMVGTMLLSGIMLKMGLYSVIRWQIPIAPQAAESLADWVLILSIAGVVYGSVVALKQDNLKTFLAYSSLAHVGLIAAGAYSGTFDGISGAVLQMVAHGFVIIGLFYAVQIIEQRYKTILISELGGIRNWAPKFTSLFIILMVASVGLPGTFNFVGEFTILYGLATVNIWYAIFGGLSIIFGAYYMLKMFQYVMLGEAFEKPFADVSAYETIVFVLIIGALIYFGLYPKYISDVLEPAVTTIVNQINLVK
ncbi:NADH-quinone oxidoreductase subunit M [Flavobacterium agricola]|uniref:NADH-quinone oxidoreductase subunit M n=2 Tax=Flavobacterium agricola TaxID=2870839 RepID=A0ABY6M2A9_9FLAO|nr:NADH-quinone oxidoreductase subunit M [Flavobacterium agricola]UYW02654.1 NADH-quinone oxidoreductase subunit M [Flavobacterium agricola]